MSKMRTFREYLAESKNETDLVRSFISYINSEDWSSMNLSQSSIKDIEEYLDIIEDEDDDALSELERHVEKIDKIRRSLKDIEKYIKNKDKISKLEKEIKTHKDTLEKLEKELSKLM